MLIGDFDIDQKSLEIHIEKHEYTWEYYFNQYAKVLNHIILISRKKQYQLNQMAMAVMFIIRHVTELYFKMKLEVAGKEIPLTHHLSKLIEDVGMKKEDFSCIDILFPETEGDCFRYLEDKKGCENFKRGENPLCVLPFLIQFVSRSEMGSYFPEGFLLNDNDKKLKWEWTFHTNEKTSLGLYKTNYDELIKNLFLSINKGDLNAQDIYLPLLFLMRHSLELGLKDNMGEVRTDLKKSQLDKFSSHSLAQLFNIIIQFVEESKENIPKTEETKKIREEIDQYIEKTRDLISSIQGIDIDSLCFRFPYDKQNKPFKIEMSKDLLSKVTLLFKETDPFISLSLRLLRYEGYI